jgi:protein involved in ribonucleotide reduction
MQLYYQSSKTRNTERFVKKLDVPESFRISKGLITTDRFVLVLPTYARNDGTGAVHKSVVDFINLNHDRLIGVIGGGHRNFGRYFAAAANIISKKCKVPILHKFELFGTDEDVYITQEKLKELYS